jgi:hypothetical protein
MNSQRTAVAIKATKTTISQSLATTRRAPLQIALLGLFKQILSDIDMDPYHLISVS